jgi:hypothetical protein
MVQAYKTGQYPLEDLNEQQYSMKQPMPSGVSLNDCLLKGAPALADPYTVTLGMREHKVAFMKDISKFYQCLEVEETAQHMRILLGFGTVQREPDVFETTKVNYGDQPADCIVIAPPRSSGGGGGVGT